jgi:hypothetical protein
MADWMTCPACQLRHSRRPDGICPRCKQAVDAGAGVAPPDTPAIDAPPPSLEPSPGPPAALAASPSAAKLGRLAQSARGHQLKSARGIMLAVGVLSVLVNGYFVASASSSVQEELDKQIAKLPPGMMVDPAKLAEIKRQAVHSTQLVSMAGVVLGVVFVVCGALVETYPVPMTITALSLYLGGTAIFAMINPASLGAGIIMKIFVVIGLFKAVQAAIAYQKDQALAT